MRRWANQDEQGRKATGITDKTVRMSVGLDHADDLIADLKQALES